MTNPLSSLLNSTSSAPGLCASNAANGEVSANLLDLLGASAPTGADASATGDFANLLGGSAGQGGKADSSFSGEPSGANATATPPSSVIAPPPSSTAHPLLGSNPQSAGARSPVASLPRAIRLERLTNTTTPQLASGVQTSPGPGASFAPVASRAQVAVESEALIATMEIVCEFPILAAAPSDGATTSDTETNEAGEPLVLGKGRLGRAEQEALMAMLAPWLAQVQPQQPLAPVAPTPAASTPNLPQGIAAIGQEGEGAPMTIDLGDGRAPAMALPVGLAAVANPPTAPAAAQFTAALDAVAPTPAPTAAASSSALPGELAQPVAPDAALPSVALDSGVAEDAQPGDSQGVLPVTARSNRGARSEGSAISAAPTNGVGSTRQSRGMRGEKNFLNAEEQQVKQVRGNAGIGVAQKDDAMATTSNPAPTTLTALQPAWGAVAREAVAEAGESATENAARRAVAAVTAVMDANAESRLKSAPSVSLRFKVGHEDLAVRIEMRGGQVRTEFRTDSAELQAAVAQEWRALAASPESLLRNQEPVFVGSNNSSSSGQGGSSLAQQQQQQGQSSAQSQARESQDHFGRIVRRVPVALAAADSPLTPLTLHSANSHRLSAVA